MIAPPLQMVEYFFTKINLEPKFGKVPQKGVYPLQTRIGFQDGKCPGELVINLGVRKGADATDEKGSYAFEIGVSGIFSADKALYDKDPEKAISIVKVNGTSMLLGAVRELVLQLTSRGPFPAYTIPALSFVDIIKPKKS